VAAAFLHSFLRWRTAFYGQYVGVMVDDAYNGHVPDLHTGLEEKQTTN
jgi:hypothetical protein